MAVCLRKVAEVSARSDVEVFTEQLMHVRARDEVVEHSPGVLTPADLKQRLYEPEGADRKRAFGLAKIILVSVPEHEPVDAELAFDLLDR